ncbi:MAG: histidinol-phosphate transaminase [Methanospirillaceae archaeon]|nr:histidinol-phosphate transaminase [Methanospirillaceae archaeon]
MKSGESLVREQYRGGGYRYAISPASLREKGISRPARLASNENPFGPSPAAVKAISRAASQVHRYPDMEALFLVSAINEHFGVSDSVVGVGMDGVIETILRVFIAPGDRVVISVPTFSYYRLAAECLSAEVVPVMREDDFAVDPGAFIDAARGSKVSFLCTPNNPTGTVTPVETVEEILNGIDGMLFLDNAYGEFSRIDYTSLMRKYRNLIIGRTFSKVYGLAGARVGFAFVPPWFVPCYETAATPFALSIISAAAARAALSDREHTEKTVLQVRQWIRKISEECRYPVLPTGANFILIDVSPMTGDVCAELLASKGVLVRSCSSFPGLPDHYIRVNIGADWENELFLEAVETL